MQTQPDPMEPARRPRVAVVSPCAPMGALSMARLDGILRYVRERRKPWRVSTFPPTTREDRLHGWRPDGVLVDAPFRVCLPAGVPSVYLREVDGLGDGHVVDADKRQLGRLASTHFLDRCFRRFACVGLADEVWSRNRREAFAEALGREGHACGFFAIGSRRRRPLLADAEIDGWVRRLEDRTAVFATCDETAFAVLRACGRVGRRVPLDLAVLGVDNVGPECDLCDPPLSSIENPLEAIGFRAAETLDRLLRGERGVPPHTAVRSPGIQPRASTAVTAVEDDLVAASLAEMRSAMGSWRGIDALAASHGVSRGTLHRRFAEAVGTGPMEQLQRLRMERAEELLESTDLSLPEVAERCGLSGSSHLTRIFKATRGLTPTAFRRGPSR